MQKLRYIFVYTNYRSLTTYTNIYFNIKGPVLQCIDFYSSGSAIWSIN